MKNVRIVQGGYQVKSRTVLFLTAPYIHTGQEKKNKTPRTEKRQSENIVYGA